jgi:hypothetical protein
MLTKIDFKDGRVVHEKGSSMQLMRRSLQLEYQHVQAHNTYDHCDARTVPATCSGSLQFWYVKPYLGSFL